ncbi:sigma-54-dependent Fis family transcriptional regulator [Candidatus Sumerlaeota bacterium]|nr:sigma-54-dependent Fis family transcriptional regulator [Candidatus Sumerlaeota bacterium]
MKIMIIDDEPKMGEVLGRALRREGWEADNFDNPLEALQVLEAAPNEFDIILSDLKMPQMDGIETLERAKNAAPGVEFVIMTAYASAQTAVESMKKGAFDYLIKPFAIDELKILVRRIMETRSLQAENTQLREQNEQLKDIVEDQFRMDNLICASPAMRRVIGQARKVSRKNATVLLRGESGSGKEVLAAAIHVNSARKDGPFLKINCGALPETLLESELFGHVKGAFTGAEANRAGLFESAHNGTLFLDEIGEVSPSLQVKLLRVLQSGEFQRVGESVTRKADARVIAATNRDLEQMLEEGAFRQDLYYRLNVVPILIPPLRERRDDIPALIEHFLRKHAVKSAEAPRRIDSEALRMLMQYGWPGNIRELENAVEHAIVMCEGDTLTAEDLPLTIKAAQGKTPAPGGISVEHMTLEELEKIAIQNALERAGNNYTRAARLLGVTRRTLGYRMEKYNIAGKKDCVEGDE